MKVSQQTHSLVFKTWKTKALATAVAIVLAVVLPQIFHAVGAFSGIGTGLGEGFLPMHLAVIMVGLLAGVYAGAITGLAAPLISFAISGMPGTVVLPFIAVELTAYGLFAGLLAEIKLHTFFKLLIVQVGGRAVRAIAVLIAYFGFGEGIHYSSIWMSVVTGLPGIILQLVLIPLIIFWVEKKTANE